MTPGSRARESGFREPLSLEKWFAVQLSITVGRRVPDPKSPDLCHRVPEPESPGPWPWRQVPVSESPAPWRRVPESESPDPWRRVPELESPDPWRRVPESESPDPCRRVPEPESPDPETSRQKAVVCLGFKLLSEWVDIAKKYVRKYPYPHV